MSAPDHTDSTLAFFLPIRSVFCPSFLASGEQKQQQELEKEMEALHMGSDASPKLDSTSPSKKGDT
jgi:hypothetical protein